MKPVHVPLAAAVLCLATLGLAKPAIHRHLHARDAQVATTQITVTDAGITTPTEVTKPVVFVDKYGLPVRTITEKVMYVPVETQGAASIEPGDATETANSTASTQAATATATVSAVANSLNVTLPGVAYAPYSASGECKTQAMVDADFARLKSKYGMVRIYGTDCDQVAKVLPAARNAGLRLFLGLFELGNVEQQIQQIVSSMDNDWTRIDTISVGNELVNKGAASAQDVLAAMRKAKTLLRSAGYQGPVVTVDTFMAVREHPELCNESDYCAMNVHPFFDGDTDAAGAGAFVTRMLTDIQARLTDSSKRIVVTETGWPWKGVENRAAIPGRNQQRAALDSIRSAFVNHPENLVLFSAFNDPWKASDAGTFFAEQYWGIDGVDSAY